MKSCRRIRHLSFFLIFAFALVLLTPISSQAAAKLSKKSIVLLTGQSTILKISGAKNDVTWTSTVPKVASVSSAGKVTAKKKGTTVITAATDTEKLSCKVTVQAPSINKKSATLKKGKSLTLKLKGTNQKITWKSSNKRIATVTKKGRVTAKKAGKATITATVLGRKFTCKITVKKASSSKKSSSSSGSGSGDVWIPKSGSKYHSRKTCSGMKNPSQVTLEEAEEMGYTACKKCY